MGTNYYAEWNVGRSTDGPVQFVTTAPLLRLHVCKSLTSFQGQVFNSWSAWRSFLLNQQWEVTIRDEYEREHDIEEFIQKVEAVPRELRSRQYEWLVAHGRADSDAPDDWSDEDGYSFHRGEFS